MTLTTIEILGLLAAIVLFSGIIFALYYVSKASSADTAPQPAVVAEARPRTAPRRRRGGLERMRQAVDENVEASASESGRGRVSKKKEQNREAKREAREAHLARLEEMRERREREEEERKEREEMEEEREREREEERRKIQEEKEKKEQEEYEEWKGLISVEEAGEEAEVKEDPEMLEKFCAYVKEGKIVVLEDLAAEFGLKTEEAIDRLTRLEENGLSGFFDDRGKFIYVSEEEMKDVAEFIERRGRVSIAELAVESTRLLNLDAAKVA